MSLRFHKFIRLAAILAVAAGSYLAFADVRAEPATNVNDDALIAKGREVYKDRANCGFCHGWAGDGAGSPRSPGGAPSLRAITLDSKAIAEIVQCGRPGTEMPHHDRMAYRDTRCYGLKRDDMEPDQVPSPGIFLNTGEIRAVAVYVVKQIVGREKVTRAECEAFWGQGSQSCQRYPE
jgi:mono/diheme cytochrome c family protein